MRRAALAVVIGTLLAGLAGRAQEAQRWKSVWDGVYTVEQAVRGKAAYDTHCSGCHRADLGGAQGRALTGPRFWQDWGEDTLESLSSITQATMPRGGAGSLPDATYFDIVAYILARNEYPAGSEDLNAERVHRVRVTGKDGPGPVPNFALVTVVGCLQRAGEVWSLIQASEPARTRNPVASQGPERDGSAATPGGPHAFELMDVFSAGVGHEGHRMEVKALLIRGTPDRLNITDMQMLADRCAP